MNKLLFSILMFLLLFSCKQNETSTTSDVAQKFNLDFEKNIKKEKLPDDWFKWGNYTLMKDTISHSGLFSGKVQASGEKKSFGCLAYKIPANYEGESITLKGYMKTENVKGYAGLMLRIDGNGKTLEFDNMNKRKIEGTNDWKEYSITLKFPREAEMIYIAGILGGEGIAWYDDFVVTIDGENIQTLQEKKAKEYKAEKDKEFDTGSKVEFPLLDESTTNNLEILGKVWGFLKYHHPTIGEGNYNWDYELFRVLPKYLQVKTTSERDQVLIDWINALGEVLTCTTCGKTQKDAVLKPDMNWIDTLGLNIALKEKLLYIYNNRFQGQHYYVREVKYIENPDFINENAYDSLKYPDAGFRLLALYRYWNMIHYFFPYKHLADKDWNTTLKEYIPLFVNAESELAYELAAVQIIGDIQDTHANLYGGDDKLEEMFGVNQAPFRARFVENKLVVTKYYKPEYKEEGKLKIGDIITHIDGKAVDLVKKELYPYNPASNEPTKDRNISRNILRSANSSVKLTYISNGKNIEHTVSLYKRENIRNKKKDSTKKSFKMLDDNIGYVTLGIIEREDIPKIKEKFRNTKGIIIDIRNYPSTFVPFILGDYFISDSTPFVKFTRMNVQNPGEFVYTEGAVIPKGTETYTGKLVVLVNEDSQSQSEYTAMAFRAGDNTTIVGSTTAGADGNISYIYLPGGLKTAISGIGVYYPDGGETQRIGIVPDVEVKPTIKGIQQGKDEVLEKAIEIIKKGK